MTPNKMYHTSVIIIYIYIKYQVKRGSYVDDDLRFLYF